MADRWLVFRGPARGQGVGSMMLGVSTALALGQQHGRMVCVSWRSFELAFANRFDCPPKHSYFSTGTSSTAFLDDDVAFEEWSFGDTASAAIQAERRQTLLQSNRTIVLMQGDGGSRVNFHWPIAFPFAPKPALATLIEATREPRLVIHLRVGDPHERSRRGALSEPALLDSLRSSLPRDAYILSDASAAYDALCDRFACPVWRALPHSAERAMRPADAATNLHTLQTWADWWSIRTATNHVLHTPSAFSVSAMRHNRLAQACVLADAQSAVACLREVVRSAPAAADEPILQREQQRLHEEAAAIRKEAALSAAAEAELAQREL